MEREDTVECGSAVGADHGARVDRAWGDRLYAAVAQLEEIQVNGTGFECRVSGFVEHIIRIRNFGRFLEVTLEADPLGAGGQAVVSQARPAAGRVEHGGRGEGLVGRA